MGNISSTDHVKNEVLYRVKEERKIVYAFKKKERKKERKGNRIGRILYRILPSKTWYWRKDIVDGKARKKT